MTGHNHYPWCACGWCLKLGGNSNQRANSPLGYLNASNETACFINPNANCPVCGANVFFYQNISGSKVFFDALGPPWPKHPCTDNKLKVIPKNGVFELNRPFARSVLDIGLISREFTGTKVLRPGIGIGFPYTKKWTPVEVLHVKIEDFAYITFRFLKCLDKQILKIRTNKDEYFPNAQDVAWFKEGWLSFFSLQEFEIIEIRALTDDARVRRRDSYPNNFLT